MRTQQCYIVKDLPIARLIDEEFIEGFVKKGNVLFCESISYLVTANALETRWIDDMDHYLGVNII